MRARRYRNARLLTCSLLADRRRVSSASNTRPDLAPQDPPLLAESRINLPGTARLRNTQRHCAVGLISCRGLPVLRTRCIAGILMTAVATVFGHSHAAPTDLVWRQFFDPGSGTRVDYPANIFSVEEGAFEIAPGRQFGSADGRAHLAVFTMKPEESSSPAEFVARNLQVPRATALDYRRVSSKFFAISGVHDADIFYVRCNSGRDRSVLHCIYLIYPAAEKRAWDSIVTRISRTLRPLSS